ncbi:MAG: hypothetical protein OEV92_13005 [Nitrospinota bacterium]|nr:hypothetical protein [Nitrospinota bacterium]
MGNFYSVSYIQTYEDHRGAVVYPFRDLGVDPASMKSMHVATIAPGEARGNHFHPNHQEFILVTGADMLLSLVTPDGRTESIGLGPEAALITIHPGVAHAIKNEGDFPCFVTCWYSGGREDVRSEPYQVLD